MKLLEVEGHVPQCPIAGDATRIQIYEVYYKLSNEPKINSVLYVAPKSQKGGSKTQCPKFEQ